MVGRGFNMGEKRSRVATPPKGSAPGAPSPTDHTKLRRPRLAPALATTAASLGNALATGMLRLFSRTPERRQKMGAGETQHHLTIDLSSELALRKRFLWHTDGDGHCLLASVLAAVWHNNLPTNFTGTPADARARLSTAYQERCSLQGVLNSDITMTVEYLEDLWDRQRGNRDAQLQMAHEMERCGCDCSVWNTTTGKVQVQNVRRCMLGMGGTPDERAKAQALIKHVYDLLADTSICIAENLMPALGHALGVRIAVVSMGRQTENDPSTCTLVGAGEYGVPGSPLMLVAHFPWSSRSSQNNHYAAIIDEPGNLPRRPLRSTSGAHLLGVTPRVPPWHTELSTWSGPEPLDSLLPPRTTTANTDPAPSSPASVARATALLHSCNLPPRGDTASIEDGNTSPRGEPSGVSLVERHKREGREAGLSGPELTSYILQRNCGARAAPDAPQRSPQPPSGTAERAHFRAAAEDLQAAVSAQIRTFTPQILAAARQAAAMERSAALAATQAAAAAEPPPLPPAEEMEARLERAGATLLRHCAALTSNAEDASLAASGDFPSGLSVSAQIRTFSPLVLDSARQAVSTERRAAHDAVHAAAAAEPPPLPTDEAMAAGAARAGATLLRHCAALTSNAEGEGACPASGIPHSPQPPPPPPAPVSSSGLNGTDNVTLLEPRSPRRAARVVAFDPTGSPSRWRGQPPVVGTGTGGGAPVAPAAEVPTSAAGAEGAGSFPAAGTATSAAGAAGAPPPPPPPGADSPEPEPEPEVVEQWRCKACGSRGGDETMLICDCCDDPWHLQCLQPPLHAIPAGDWLCPTCTALLGRDGSPAPPPPLCGLEQELKRTTDARGAFQGHVAFVDFITYLATDDCGENIKRLQDTPPSTGSFHNYNADMAFAKVQSTLLRTLGQVSLGSTAHGRLLNVFMQLALLLKPRVGRGEGGEASTETLSKECITKCALFTRGRIKKLYADAVKSGKKLNGDAPSLPGGPIKGPLHETEPADAMEPGTSLAEYLQHLESSSDPNESAEDAQTNLARRLWRGAGSDPAVWPQGAEGHDTDAFLARIRRGASAPPPAGRRAHQPAPVAGEPSQATTEEALRHAQLGHLSKARRLLVDVGMATHDARAEMFIKHPSAPLPSTDAHPAEQWLPPGDMGAPHLRGAEHYLTVDSLRTAVKKSKAGGASDYTGERTHEDFHHLFATADNDVLEVFRERVAEPFFTGVFPEGAFGPDYLYGGTLMALSKAPKPGSRPIAIGLALRRLTHRAALANTGISEDLGTYFTQEHPRVLQLAGGVPDGASHGFKLIESLLEHLRVWPVLEDPDDPGTPLDRETEEDPYVVSAADRSNAFNCVNRQTLLDHLAGTASCDYDLGVGPNGEPGVKKGDALQWCTSALQPLHASIKAMYGGATTLRHFSKASGSFLHLSSTLGVHQGCVMGSTLFCATMHPIICRVLDRHPGVFAICYADNVFLVGRASIVLPAHEELDRHLLQDMGVAHNPREAFLYAPLWAATELHAAPQSFYEMAARVAPTMAPTLPAAVRLDGIQVLGCPLGTPDFVKASLDALTANIAADLAPCARLDDGLAFLHIVRFCIQSRQTYALRTSYPSLSVRSAKALDTLVHDAFSRYVGWGRSALAPDASMAAQHSWSRLAFFGKLDDGWLGATLNELVAPAAFYSAHCRFINWVTKLEVSEHLGQLKNPGHAWLDSLNELEEVHNSLLAAGAFVRNRRAEFARTEPGARMGHAGSQPDSAVAPEEPAGAVGLFPLEDLHDQVNMPVRSSGEEIKRFPTQRHCYNQLFNTHGPQNSLVAPLPQTLWCLARGRSSRTVVLGEDGTEAARGDLRGLCADYHGITFRVRPMAALYNIRAAPELRLSKEEFGVIMCMMMGMEVVPPGPPQPCAGCGRAVDAGGHHFLTCSKRAAYNAGHAFLQAFICTSAHIPSVSSVAENRRQGLPEQEPQRGGKRPDCLIKVFRQPTPNGPRLHQRSGIGGMAIDVRMSHEFTGQGVFRDDQANKVAREKIDWHQKWLNERGLPFSPVISTTLGDATNDTYRLLFLIAWLRAEARESSATAALGVHGAGPGQSVEQLRGLIFNNLRSGLFLTVLRATALRLTGKHWDRRLSAAQRRTLANRADEEFDAAPAPSGRPPAVGAYAAPPAVVQAFPVGEVGDGAPPQGNL